MQPNHDRITSDVIYQEPALWVWAGRGKEEVLYEPASLLCKQVLQYTFLDTVCQFLDIGGLQHDDCCVTMIIIDRSQEGVKGGKCPGSSLAMHPSGPYLGWLCSICFSCASPERGSSKEWKCPQNLCSCLEQLTRL